MSCPPHRTPPDAGAPSDSAPLWATDTGSMVLATALRGIMLRALGTHVSLPPNADNSSSAGSWRIGTAPAPPHTSGHHHYALEEVSDPLGCTAQRVVAAASAAAAPGVHAPQPDVHTVLNSGAMLLLGHGSTTISGSNTQLTMALAAAAAAGGAGAGAGAALGRAQPQQLQPPCGSAAASSRAHTVQQPAGAQRPGCTHMPQLPPPPAAAAAAAGGNSSSQRRRRQGLLVDCANGMQQLVSGGQQDDAAEAEEHQQHLATQQLRTARPAGQRQQQQQLQFTDHGHPPPGGELPRGSSMDSSAGLPSGDMLVLGQSDTPLGHVQTAAAAAPAASAGRQPLRRSGSGSRAAAAATGNRPPQQPAQPSVPPVLQLLSCGSLASFMMAANSSSIGGSNSSLLAGGSGSAQALTHFLGNNGVLRLSSFTSSVGAPAWGAGYGGGGSCSSHADSSFTSRPGSMLSRGNSFTAPGGSFTSLRTEPGQTGATATLAAAAAALTAATLTAGGSAVAAAAASRPSPLPMLREHCSWGSNLNEAVQELDETEECSATQLEPSVCSSGASPSHVEQQEGCGGAGSVEPAAQLIYLLD